MTIFDDKGRNDALAGYVRFFVDQMLDSLIIEYAYHLSGTFETSAEQMDFRIMLKDELDRRLTRKIIQRVPEEMRRKLEALEPTLVDDLKSQNRIKAITDVRKLGFDFYTARSYIETLQKELSDAGRD